MTVGENPQIHRESPILVPDANADGRVKVDTKLIALNMKSHRMTSFGQRG